MGWSGLSFRLQRPRLASHSIRRLTSVTRNTPSTRNQAYNLGNGQGFSVQEVIDTAQQVTGRTITVVDGPRRAGDPSRLVADARNIRDALGWQPRYADLATIVEHAWRWETRSM